jgi:Fic family protein
LVESRPAQLEAVRRVSVVNSIESSNAIEDIVVSRNRIETLADHFAEPTDRPESEIAGYAHVLELLHRSANEIEFEPRHVLQLHGYLGRYTQDPSAGHWKRLDNTVMEVLPDGTRRVRFQPVAADLTPQAMDDLHNALARAEESGEYHWLLLVAAYLLDFLTIHPFRDGNGRMSRLITIWLLYRGGYGVVRYVSLERLIDQSRDSYFRALSASTAGWHEGEHDLGPWVDYFVGIVHLAHVELDRLTDGLGTRGRKQRAVRRSVDEFVGDRFSLEDLRQANPGVSDPTLRQVLRELQAEGSIALEGRGRGAKWRRVSRPDERAH